MKETKQGFFSKISKAIAGKSTVDEEVLDTLEEALNKAYKNVEKVTFGNAFYRKDIGAKAKEIL